MKRAIVSSAVAAVTAGGLLTGGAAAPAAAAPPPCGYYQVGSNGFVYDSMYNHCGDGPVLVTIVGLGIYNEYDACLTPGVHDLNDYFHEPVINAYSEGEPCNDPDEPWG